METMPLQIAGSHFPIVATWDLRAALKQRLWGYIGIMDNKMETTI